MQKKVIVTGGASGIGKSIAELFLNNEHQVIILDINPDPILDWGEKFKGLVNIFKTDVSNFSDLEKTFNESEVVLCRSGYTTVMDLTKLEKKAFFIPTPGQFEQEYLAKKLKNNNLVPYVEQDNFRIEALAEIKNYQGLPIVNTAFDWADLLKVFDDK